MEIKAGTYFETGGLVVAWFQPSRILCGCRKKDIFKLRLLKIACKFLLGWRVVDEGNTFGFGIITGTEWEEAIEPERRIKRVK